MVLKLPCIILEKNFFPLLRKQGLKNVPTSKGKQPDPRDTLAYKFMSTSIEGCGVERFIK